MMRSFRRLTAVGLMLATLAGPFAALAVEPDEMLADPKLEARADALSKELRCVVCQNQNIDSSSAPLARDMRLLVRERIAAGDSDAEVKAYMVARYGNFVLLKPPLQADTLALWLGPLAILLAVGATLVAAARSGAPEEDLAPGTDAEEF
jgi:cytochrome c-type biogenesis protein CcmH